MSVASSVPEQHGPTKRLEDLIVALKTAQADLDAAVRDQDGALVVTPTTTQTLLNRAQGVLLASEARYRHLLSGMGVVVFELDADGTLLFVNDAVSTTTGFEPGELLGKNWWDTFFPGVQRRQGDVLYAQLQKGDVSNYELTLSTKNGSSLTLELNSTNTYRSDGTLERILGLGVDITERKRVEQRTQLLTDTSVTLAAALDYRTTLTRLAQLAVPTVADWCTVHVIDKAGLVQQVAISHSDPDMATWASEQASNYPPLPNTKSAVWRVLQTGKAELYPEITDAMLVDRALDAQHLEFLRRMGFASLMIVPLIARGQVLGAVQFVASTLGRQYDASDLSFAQELAYRAASAVDNARLYQEAQEQRTRLQITLSSIGDAVIATDGDGYITFMNVVAESLTGWSQEEAAGKALHQVFPIVDETSRQPIENLVAQVKREGKTTNLSKRSLLLSRSGTAFNIDDSAAPILDEAGAIVGVILVFRDITAQRRAQMALHDSEQRFKAIFDQAALGMVQSTTDGHWLLANQRFCEMVGYSQQELLSHSFTEFTHPDDLPYQWEQTQRVMAGEIQKFAMEKRYLRKDGSYVWTSITASLVRSLTDNVDYFVTIIQDITDRKKADEQVRFQAYLLDTVGQAVIASDLQANVLYWNRFAETLYGWSAAEALGHSLAELVVNSATFEQAVEILTRLKSGESWMGEFVCQRKDGTVFPALVSNTPIYDANGTMVAIIGISTDMTERKQAEEALAGERNLLRTLIDAIPDCIYVKDRESRFLIGNSASAEFLGAVTPDNLIGKTDFDFHDQENAVQFYADEQAVIQSGQPVLNKEEYALDHRIGTMRWQLTTTLPLRNTSGAITGIVAVGRDITDNKRMNETEHEQRLIAETLASVTVALTSQLGLENVLGEILHQSQRLVPYTTANIALLDGETLRVARWENFETFGSEHFLEGLVQSLADLPVDREAVLSRQPVIVADTQSDPRWIIYPPTAWIRSAIVAPICLSNEVLGVLRLESDVPGGFTSIDAARLQPLTSAAAIALENAHLFSQAQQEVAERKRAEQAEHEQRVLAEALRSTAASLTSTLDPQIVMARILEGLGQVVPHDFANIMLLEGDSARIAYRQGYDQSMDALLGSYLFSIADTRNLREMRDTGLPTLIADTSTDPDWVRTEIDSENRIRSFIGVPIKIHGQVIGFLNLDSLEPNFFTLVHVERLQAFADQAAVAIENAQLYAELVKYAAELERRVAERTIDLSNAKDRVEAILNSSGDAIIVMTMDGRINEQNPAFRSLFGYELDEAVGQSITALAAPDHEARLLNLFKTVARDAQTSQIEIVACRRDGTFFDADLTLSPIVGTDGKTMSIVCSGRDISRRTKLDSELRKALEKERELSELKSRFVSIVSHEFRTPLAAILTATDLLAGYSERMTGEQQQARLRQIKSEIKRLTGLLEDILVFGKVQASRNEIKREAVELDGFCREVIEAIQIATGASHHLVFTYRSDQRMFNLDIRLLRHILVNLLSNAVKYSPPGSTVSFDVAYESQHLLFSIEDRGIGIPADDQGHLFQEFHRATNVGSVPGTGLGLAIVKQAVEQHGGILKFESQMNVGTTFTVILPIDAT